MKRLLFCLIFLCGLSLTVNAKTPSKIWRNFINQFASAEKHKGLDSPHYNLELSKIKCYVVLMKGGVPAERAPRYISWEDYDYRGVDVDGNEIATRRGAVYTYLKAGDVLAVVDVDKLGRKFYLKLISPEVYIPENRSNEKYHSPVTLLLGIKLPKDIYKSDDVERANAVIYDWLKPFKSLEEARAFAGSVR